MGRTRDQPDIAHTKDANVSSTRTGAHCAKENALNKAVWNLDAPGRKRVLASTTTPQEAARKKKKKQVNKPQKVVDQTQHATPEHTNSNVSIPLPSAPKKSRQATKSQSSQKVVKSGKNGKQAELDPFINDDEDEETEGDEDDNNENDLSGADCASEDATHSEDESAPSNDESRPQAAADKRFANEQPVWTDIANKEVEASLLHITSAHDANEQISCALCQTESGAARSLIIRGQVIEISDNDTDVDDSPLTKLAPPSTYKPKQEVAEPNAMQGFIVAAPQANVVQPSSANLNTLPTPSDLADAGLIWPAYTNLIRGSRDVALNVQTWELKLIIKKAMDLVEERVRFENAFLSLVTRTVWNQRALLEASSTVGNFPPASAHVKEKYEMFKERLRVDTEYIGEISKTLLDPRISILRGDTKNVAINNAHGAYGLQSGCGQQVQQLLMNSRYIYPSNANGTGFQFHKPFENNSIIGTLRDDLFMGNNAIVVKYPHRFNNELELNKLMPSMIALAATAVYAALKEWETGHHLPTNFSANLFESIYRTHIKHLETIQALNENGYNALLQRLFHMVSNTEETQTVDFDLTDVQNMSTEVNGD